jgi:glutathione S-transferase
MLTIWGRRSSFNVQKVMWLIGELGLEHQHIPAGGRHGIKDTPAFRAMNPHGRVPVINDNGVVIWESHSILRYLAARYGAADLWSDDAAARSQADSWMDWAQSSLQPAFLTGVFWGFYRTPPEQRDAVAVGQSIKLCAQHFQIFDQFLSKRQFLAQDKLSLADIPVGTHLYRYFELDIERPSLPNVENWYLRLKDRPAYVEHVMIPFDDLRGRLEY